LLQAKSVREQQNEGLQPKEFRTELQTLQAQVEELLPYKAAALEQKYELRRKKIFEKQSQQP
jgi:hypothetical protein